MNFFLILNGKKIRNTMLLVLTAFVTAWFLYIENIARVPVFSSSDGPRAIYKGNQGIALTFNIGWGDEKAEPILDVLEKEGIKSATFFLSGSWAERHQHIVERINKLGYDIGLLGYEYEDYTELSDAKIRQDILKAIDVFKKMNIKTKPILRAPTGNFDTRLVKIADRMGYTVVHWSVDSKDWKNPGVEEIVKNIEKAKKGDIILLHASDSAKQTAVALPIIIQKLNHLKFVTISELIADAKTSSKEIQ